MARRFTLADGRAKTRGQLASDRCADRTSSASRARGRVSGTSRQSPIRTQRRCWATSAASSTSLM